MISRADILLELGYGLNSFVNFIQGIIQTRDELIVENNELKNENKALREQLKNQHEEIEQLKELVKVLQAQLNQNSRNSSRPPSSDGLHKQTVSLRKSGGKMGAPKGHPGHTLQPTEHPDRIVKLAPQACPKCSNSLLDAPVAGVEKRQVFDMPIPQIIVTEWQAEHKWCPCCNHIVEASFPAEASAPVQYGPGFAAWTVYLNARHMMPLERIQELFADFTGQCPSEATLLAMMERMHGQLAPHEAHIKEQLAQAPVLHSDETGCRVMGKTEWIITHSTSGWTYLSVQDTRATGLKQAGILPKYKGTVVHDCFPTYFKFEFANALCCAHLMRECIGIEQNDKQPWATQMKELLNSAWQMTKEARAKNSELTSEVRNEIERRYDEILKEGASVWHLGAVKPKTGPRGRKSKSKAQNLGERLLKHKEAVLRFLCDARVPFDNNQAERDLRMVKVKQKVSGSFRTWNGAEMFTRAHGFISTLRKQSKPVLQSLIAVARDQFTFADQG